MTPARCRAASEVAVSDDTCPHCSHGAVSKLAIRFRINALPPGLIIDPYYVGCGVCDELLQEIIQQCGTQQRMPSNNGGGGMQQRMPGSNGGGFAAGAAGASGGSGGGRGANRGGAGGMGSAANRGGMASTSQRGRSRGDSNTAAGRGRGRGRGRSVGSDGGGGAFAGSDGFNDGPSTSAYNGGGAAFGGSSYGQNGGGYAYGSNRGANGGPGPGGMHHAGGGFGEPPPYAQGQVPRGSSGSGGGGGGDVPLCPKHNQPLLRLTSRSVTNPGRVFFKCADPLESEQNQCLRFMWADDYDGGSLPSSSQQGQGTSGGGGDRGPRFGRNAGGFSVGSTGQRGGQRGGGGGGGGRGGGGGAAAGAGGGQFMSATGERGSDVCYKCQQRGHWSRDCPFG